MKHPISVSTKPAAGQSCEVINWAAYYPVRNCCAVRSRSGTRAERTSLRGWHRKALAWAEVQCEIFAVECLECASGAPDYESGGQRQNTSQKSPHAPQLSSLPARYNCTGALARSAHCPLPLEPSRLCSSAYLERCKHKLVQSGPLNSHFQRTYRISTSCKDVTIPKGADCALRLSRVRRSATSLSAQGSRHFDVDVGP